MHEPSPPDSRPSAAGAAGDGPPRRRFMATLSTTAMGVGLVAAYGSLAGFFGRFLYPAGGGRTGWMFVSDVAGFAPDSAINFRLPSGARVVIAHQGRGETVDDFIALSSTCPHLGCQVHWEAQNDRFFCPCHNGVFDPSGIATGGPPGKAGQRLLRFPLKVEAGLLYLEVAFEEMAMGEGTIIDMTAPRGPGHDPCLDPEAGTPA